MRALTPLLALVAAVAGSGCESNGPASNPADVPRYPVAYELPRSVAGRLADVDAMRLIEREGRVVATSEWEPYTVVVLDEWLRGRGIVFDEPDDLTPVRRRVGSSQDLSLLVISSEDRRLAGRLARLHPSESRLRTFYERFNEVALGTAGEAMLDWIEILKRVVAEADSQHVVVIPLLD